MYYFDSEYDLKYAGLDPQYILAFLAKLKNSKPRGKYYGDSHMGKFYNAIKWFSVLVNQWLLTNFYSKLDTFLTAYKWEFTDQKKKGNVEERVVDAISSTLFTMLMKWAVQEGSVFVWSFALLMLYLMARSIKINSVALHSIKRGISDSITFKYDEMKVDKTGAFACKKMFTQILMNHLSVCLQPLVATSVSIQRCLNILSIFSLPVVQDTSSQNFAHQVAAMGVRYAHQIKHFLRLSHFNIMGWERAVACMLDLPQLAPCYSHR